MDIKTLEMNIEKLKEILNCTKTDIKILEDEIEKIKNNKQCRWKPEVKEEYYNILGGSRIQINTNNNSIYDNGSISIGNKFKTREEAEFVLEKLKVIEELRQFEEPKDREWNNNNCHFHIHYDTVVKTITIGCCSRIKSNNIYFESREIAEQAIKSVGEDRIKKYFLEV